MIRWTRFARVGLLGFAVQLATVQALVVFFGSGPASAATLTAGTLAAWERYVERVEARLARESRNPDAFVGAIVDEPGSTASGRIRIGRDEVLVMGSSDDPVDLGTGTINHWRGFVFVPGVTVDQLLDVAAHRTADSSYWQEDVLEMRLLDRGPDSLRLFLKLQRKAIVTATYNTEHLVRFERHGPHRASSRSLSTKIAELQDPGTPGERERPAGQDRGFLWRLNSYWQYEAVPGGVIVELESLTLSRGVPWAVRAVAGPVIDAVARDSMTRTLAALRAHWEKRVPGVPVSPSDRAPAPKLVPKSAAKLIS